MIEHIVFDFGGVILDLDGVYTGYPDNLAVIFGLPVAETKQIWDEHKTAVIAGQETPKEFLARLKAERHLDFDVDQGIAYWEEQNLITPERIDWDLVERIKQLKAKYQIHMLTDQIQLGNGAQDWIHKVHDQFHTIFRSYEQGYRKPFPEAYQNLLQKIDATLNPESVVFIDDNQLNVQAAHDAGINGILYSFSDHAHLRSELEKLGVRL